MKVFEITGYAQIGRGTANPVKAVKIAENAEVAKKSYVDTYYPGCETVLRVREIYVNSSSDDEDDD